VYHEEETELTDEEEQAHDEHNEHKTVDGESEVDPLIEVDKDQLTITLVDEVNQPVTELEINHEKIVHLIIVDEHLNVYSHLHPEEVAPGQFKVNHGLKDGNYKAFVDIKPTNLSYTVHPINFAIGEAEQGHQHDTLDPDVELTQTVNGHEVTMYPSSLKIDEPVQLIFELDIEKLEPYLGAMGHVVILDEQANNYLHVHPVNEEEPIFETTFTEPGIYKIWAEFQQNGIVNVYPFVVEIE
jgi:hypothetical protein